MQTTKNYGGLDRFRIAAALLVIAIHISPLAAINESADFFLTRVLARIAVPFFFMVTGQFVVTRFMNPAGEAISSGTSVLISFLKKTGLLYGLSILLYLPVGIYAGHYQKLNPGTILRMLLFDGTFYHLWYFPACIIGVLLVYLLSRFLSLQAMTAVSAVLYVIGLLGDSYYGLVQKVPFLESIYDFFFQAFSYTRNGLFLAPVFLILGAWAGVMAEKAKRQGRAPDPASDCIGLIFSFAIMCGEAFLLRHFEFQRHDSMYLMLIPTMFFLYQCLLASGRSSHKGFRIAAAWIYILHPGFIVLVRAVAKPLQMTELLVDNNLVHYIIVTLLSVSAGALFAYIQLQFPVRSLLSRKSREQKIGEVCDLIDMEEQNRYASEQNESDLYDSHFEESDFEKSDFEEPDFEKSHSKKSHINKSDFDDFYGQMTSEDEAVTEALLLEQPDIEEYDTDTAPAAIPDTRLSGRRKINGTTSIRENPEIVAAASNPPDDRNEIDIEPQKPLHSTAKPKTLTEQSGLNSVPPRKPTGKRAWIEIDSAALEQNVAFLRSLLPEHCRLMPAVKAEAYGHGGVMIARLLNTMGIDAFCVACIAEGIALREAGIKGGILILGYTPPEDFSLLHRYHLTQTVVDYDYARLLNRFGNPLHVHLAIDTGMHRLGIRCENLEEILDVCKMTNLSVDGFFTHLAVSDSLLRQDVIFTEAQIQAFYQVIGFLRKKGIRCRGLHLLASYGILNLLPEREAPETSAQKAADLHAAEYQPEYQTSSSNTVPETKQQTVMSAAKLAADFVRPGIVIYGLLSSKADSNTWRNFLQPVLSLKAKVTSVRPLYAGEATGYGAAFTAKRDMRIAALSIGYADGLPRELSYGKGSVLINGYRAPILGRICMDQTIVDVSRIPRIQPGDTAVIIGKSGKLENTADSLAAQCDTITNELLSRLGGRLDRILL